MEFLLKIIHGRDIFTKAHVFYCLIGYYADALTWGLISNKPDKLKLFISEHALFGLCFFLFSQECTVIANKYTNNLNVDDKGRNFFL